MSGGEVLKTLGEFISMHHRFPFRFYCSFLVVQIGCQTWVVPSRPPEAINRPSGDHASGKRGVLWPSELQIVSPMDASQTCTMPLPSCQ